MTRRFCRPLASTSKKTKAEPYRDTNGSAPPLSSRPTVYRTGENSNRKSVSR
jgi:hypothetical protein